MHLKLKFLSKCLQLHPGDKFQVLKLLQGEGGGDYLLRLGYQESLWDADKKRWLLGASRRNTQSLREFGTERTAAGGTAAACMVGRAPASSSQMLPYTVPRVLTGNK